MGNAGDVAAEPKILAAGEATPAALPKMLLAELLAGVVEPKAEDEPKMFVEVFAAGLDGEQMLKLEKRPSGAAVEVGAAEVAGEVTADPKMLEVGVAPANTPGEEEAVAANAGVVAVGAAADVKTAPKGLLVGVVVAGAAEDELALLPKIELPTEEVNEETEPKTLELVVLGVAGVEKADAGVDTAGVETVELPNSDVVEEGVVAARL